MTEARLLELKKLRQANSDTIDVDPIIEAFATATDSYEYLLTLSEKELIATKAWLFNNDIELAYAKTKSKLVYEVNKGIAKLLD